jgi:hypothetical protein
MRYLIISLTIFTLLTSFWGVGVTPAQATDCVPKNNGVCLLQPDIVNGQEQEVSLGHYLSLLFGTLIALAGGIAVLLIVVGGLQYILSEVPGVKSSGKERISNALVGLILALSAWLILNTINPDLINFKLDL